MQVFIFFAVDQGRHVPGSYIQSPSVKVALTDSRNVLSLSTKTKTLGTKCNRAQRKARKETKKKATSPNHEHPLVKNKEEKVLKSFFFLINYSAASS